MFGNLFQIIIHRLWDSQAHHTHFISPTARNASFGVPEPPPREAKQPENTARSARGGVMRLAQPVEDIPKVVIRQRQPFPEPGRKRHC